MTQQNQKAEVLQGNGQAETSRPVLTLVPDIYDPDPVLVSMARWYFNQALSWLEENIRSDDEQSIEQALEQVYRSFRQVLDLAEHPFSPNPRLTYAKTAFKEMKDQYEKIYGKGNLPSKIYGWAKKLGIFEKPQVTPKQVDPVAAAAKRAEAERKRRERSEKNKAERAAMKGPAGGGGGKKSAK